MLVKMAFFQAAHPDSHPDPDPNPHPKPNPKQAATRRVRSVCTQRYLVLELRLLTRLYGIDDAPDCPPDTSLPPGA